MINQDLYNRWRGYRLPVPVSIPAALEPRIGARVAEAARGEARRPLTGATQFTEDVLLHVVATCGFYHQAIGPMLQIVRRVAATHHPAPISYTDVPVAAAKLANSGLLDNELRQRLLGIVGPGEPDCKHVSAMWYAAYLCLAKPSVEPPASVRVSLVSGLVFHDQVAPEGVGHSWVELDGVIIDASITTAGAPQLVAEPHDGYVAITSVDSHLELPALHTDRRMSVRALWDNAYDVARLAGS